MRKIICDRCGAEIPKGARIGYVAVAWQSPTDGTILENSPYEGMDFCDHCMNTIVACIDNVDINREEPEELARRFVNAMKQASAMEPEELEEVEESEPEDYGPDPDQEEAAEEPAEELPVKEEYKGVNLRKLRELVKAGKSDKEIAKELGCSIYMYKKHRKKAEELWKAGLIWEKH